MQINSCFFLSPFVAIFHILLFFSRRFSDCHAGGAGGDTAVWFLTECDVDSGHVRTLCDNIVVEAQQSRQK